MDISVRTQFPERGEYDWGETLKEFESIGVVETAFYLPQPYLKSVNIEEVISPFKKLKIKCGSLHMAHARITEPFLFEAISKKTIEIARALDCNIIVAHPSFARLKDVESFIDDTISPLLERNAVYLCWETFSGKRRFLSGLEEIANFCQKRKWYKACFDFSHIHEDQEKILEDIDKYFSAIKIFHVSNRITMQKLQHLPLFHEKADLDFHRILNFLKDKDFPGVVVLEYLPEYHGYLKKDAQVLIKKYATA